MSSGTVFITTKFDVFFRISHVFFYEYGTQSDEIDIRSKHVSDDITYARKKKKKRKKRISFRDFNIFATF